MTQLNPRKEGTYAPHVGLFRGYSPRMGALHHQKCCANLCLVFFGRWAPFKQSTTKSRGLKALFAHGHLALGGDMGLASHVVQPCLPNRACVLSNPQHRAQLHRTGDVRDERVVRATDKLQSWSSTHVAHPSMLHRLNCPPQDPNTPPTTRTPQQHPNTQHPTPLHGQVWSLLRSDVVC